MTGDHTPDPAESPGLRDLQDLINTGGWRTLPGPPDMLIFIHPYPDGSVDTLAVKGETDTFAERTNSSGAPVWHREGGLSDIIGLLRALPSPFAPDAPRRVTGGGTASWTWTP